MRKQKGHKRTECHIWKTVTVCVQWEMKMSRIYVCLCKCMSVCEKTEKNWSMTSPWPLFYRRGGKDTGELGSILPLNELLYCLSIYQPSLQQMNINQYKYCCFCYDGLQTPDYAAWSPWSVLIIKTLIRPGIIRHYWLCQRTPGYLSLAGSTLRPLHSSS